MRRTDLTAAVVCVFLPLVIGAPVDDIKQQIASGLLRSGNDDPGYWNTNSVNQDMYPDDILQHAAAQYSLGRGRSLDGMGSDWVDVKGVGWRFGNTPKRGGGRNYGGNPFRRLDSPNGYQNLQKRFDSLSGATFGAQKRNFDEIDRNGFGSFLKRNFDEIDRNGFGFNKRNFDEIDRTGFGSFVKRAI